MAHPAERKATYADLVAVPGHLVAEILHGQLVTHPRPAAPHARAASVLGGDLSGPFDRGRGGPGGWLILDEPELHLDEHVMVPDLAGWRRERMPEMPHTAAFELAPDWVCEVLSPGTAGTDRAVKLPLYAEHSVMFIWLVDPLVQTLEAYRLEGSRYSLLGTWHGDAMVRAEPFDAIDLALSDLWSR